MLTPVLPSAVETKATFASDPGSFSFLKGPGPAAEQPAVASVFVSHSSADKGILRPLVARLTHLGIYCWFDEETVLLGDTIVDGISKGLAASDYLLVAWSKAAADSPIVGDEISAFYLRTPEPGRILFLRLDSTPVPTLFAARRYMDSTCDAERDAQSIARWVKCEPSARIAVAVFEAPDPSMLQQFARGPAVDDEWITWALAKGFATQSGTVALADARIGEANRLRRMSDPLSPRDMICLDVTELPTLGPGYVPSAEYWFAVLRAANRKGRRMLAALLLLQDDSRLPEDARRDRATLLRVLADQPLSTSATH